MRVVAQSVCIEGIARSRLIEAEIQPLGGGVGRDPCLGSLGGGSGQAVLDGEAFDRIALRCGRRVRVELEAAPPDIDLPTVLEGGQGVLESALADVAPGTDDVR